MPFNQVETAFVEEFSDNLGLLAQQMTSKITQFVNVKGVMGKAASVAEYVGDIGMTKRTTRHGDTQYTDIDRERKWVIPTDYDVAHLVDKPDEIRSLISLESGIARAFAASMERKKDDVIIEGAFGTNFVGETHSVADALPAGQIIPHGSAGMNLDKLLEAKFRFENANVDMQGYQGMGGRYGACAVITPKQIVELLNVLEVGSADYNSVKALVNGDVDTFMGFKFVTCNRLPGAADYDTVYGTQAAAAGESHALFFAGDAITLGVFDDAAVFMDIIPQKLRSLQILATMTLGATRNENVRVLKVISQDT